jgi:peptide chain release factor
MLIQISSGTGPDECQLAVKLFVDRLIKTNTKNEKKVELLNLEEGEIKGNMKSCLLRIEDGLNIETGSVLWICKSPYRKNCKRKNWYIDIKSYEEYHAINFLLSDIEIDVFRSSGPGGQNVNKLDSAVRVKHKKTGISVTSMYTRSQHTNKGIALSILQDRLNNLNNQRESNFNQCRWKQHYCLERGNPIYIYEGEKFVLKKQGHFLQRFI